MDKGNLLLLTEIYMKENGLMTKLMVMVRFIMQMGQYIKVSGNIIHSMAKEQKLG